MMWGVGLLNLFAPVHKGAQSLAESALPPSDQAVPSHQNGAGVLHPPRQQGASLKLLLLKYSKESFIILLKLQV